MKNDPILVPVSAGDLTLLEWFGQWTPDVHRADWPKRRAWPPGYREIEDLSARGYKDEEEARLRMSAPPDRRDRSRVWNLLAYGLLEGYISVARLTARGRAALKLAGREVPDAFESHAPDVFDPVALAPHHETAEDCEAYWRDLLVEYREDDYRGRHTLTAAQASLTVGHTGQEGLFLNGSIRAHHRTIRLHVQSADGIEVCEALFSLEGFTDLLTSSARVPATLTRFFGRDGMLRCEPAPPPVSPRRRMLERLDRAEAKQEDVLRELRESIEKTNNLGKKKRDELLRHVDNAVRLGKENRAFVVTQAAEEVSAAVEGALSVAGDRLALAAAGSLPASSALLAISGFAPETAVDLIPAAAAKVLVATDNTDEVREAAEAIARTYRPREAAGEVISRRAFWSEQAGRWRVRFAVDSPEDPEMIFDVVDVAGPGIDGNGLDLERV